MRRFDCYPDDFLVGTQGLGPVLGWAYTRLFMKMYSEEGPLEYDPQKLKHLLEMRPQDVRKVVEALVQKGKLFLVGGLIHNQRTISEISKYRNGENSNHYAFRKNDPSNDAQMALHLGCHNSEKPNDSTRARAPASPSPSNKDNLLLQSSTSALPFFNGSAAIGPSPAVNGRSGPTPPTRAPPSATARKLIEDGLRRKEAPP